MTLSESESSSNTVIINQSVTGPTVSISPATHNYGSVQAVSGAQNKDFIISTTAELATIASLSSSNSAFSLQNDNCSNAVITKSSSCTVTVTFAPQSLGTASSLVTVPFKLANSTESQETTFTLQGVGSAAASNFTGISGYSNLNSTSVDLNWDHDSAAQQYLVYSVSGINETLLATI